MPGPKMEQKHGLPPLSASYPWLIAQNLEAEDNTADQIFCTIPDQLSHYRCRIPELFGRCIRGYFHGWVILSKKVMWSLWNPGTRKIIHLPPLILKDGDSEFIGQCCLSSPLDDPNSVLLLTRTTKPTLVFCRLDCKRNIYRWTEMSYARQLKNITGFDCYLYCPTSYNGKVYALNTGRNRFVIQVDIVVNKDRDLIRLQLFGNCPFPSYNGCSGLIYFLKGACTKLFFVIVAFNELTNKTLGNVYLFKWVMPALRWKEIKERDLKNITMWEEMADLKNAVFFVDLVRDYSIYYRHGIASELGGHVHIRDEMGKMIYSYDVEDKTISLSSVPFPTCHVSLWECSWLEGDHRETQCGILDSKQEGKDRMLATSVMDNKVEFNSMMMHESGLQNIPFHILEMIMELCVGVEYLHFRATCKRCHLAAPLIQWSNKEAATLISPWLMVVDQNKGIITFTDPMFGDKYFMRKSEVSIRHDTICCSRFGWLLFHNSADTSLVFVNPFTSDIRKLPLTWRYLDSLCFSAPPTSPDCMVAGFTLKGEPYVYIHLVARERTWRRIRLNFDGAGPYSFCFPTLYGRDLYTIRKNGELYVFKNIVQEQEQDYSWSRVVGAQSGFGQYFLVNCDQSLLLVMVGRFGETVELFKLNDYNLWEMIDSIGRHMIYISGTTCLSIEAKTSEMENKIFFPRLHSKNGKIVFYSLETCRFHTFNGKNIEENSNVGIEHVNPNVWIEPSWS